ncbi:MAG: hypothetical protein SGPRY_011413, partial [Prymnesium sp.]
FYQKTVAPMLQDVDTAGELVKTCLVMRGGDEEIEVDGTDEMLQYVQMGISKVVFYTEAADVAASTPLASKENYRRLTLLYAEIRKQLEAKKLGFAGSVDLEMGNSSGFLPNRYTYLICGFCGEEGSRREADKAIVAVFDRSGRVQKRQLRLIGVVHKSKLLSSVWWFFSRRRGK